MVKAVLKWFIGKSLGESFSRREKVAQRAGWGTVIEGSVPLTHRPSGDGRHPLPSGEGSAKTGLEF